MIIESMAQVGAEPTFCMGDDTPLPVLSSKPHMLSDYFKQRFAQARAFALYLSGHFRLLSTRREETVYALYYVQNSLCSPYKFCDTESSLLSTHSRSLKLSHEAHASWQALSYTI